MQRDRDAELSDGIEITFSVSPEIRRSRFHDPWTLSPDDHFFCYRFSQSALVDDGTPLPDHQVELRGVAGLVDVRRIRPDRR